MLFILYILFIKPSTTSPCSDDKRIHSHVPPLSSNDLAFLPGLAKQASHFRPPFLLLHPHIPLSRFF